MQPRPHSLHLLLFLRDRGTPSPRLAGPFVSRRQGVGMVLDLLWWILIIVLIVWVLGLVFRVAGKFIHILLIVALAILVYKLLVR
jgi:hypothetical protein